MRYKSGCDTDSSGRETSFSAVGRRRISAALTTCLYMNERCRMDAFASLKGFSRYFASCPCVFGLFVIIEVKHSTLKVNVHKNSISTRRCKNPQIYHPVDTNIIRHLPAKTTQFRRCLLSAMSRADKQTIPVFFIN